MALPSAINSTFAHQNTIKQSNKKAEKRSFWYNNLDEDTNQGEEICHDYYQRN
jgi:hypothetical protein